MSRFDIGIYGLWYGHNYGSIITYYALYKTLEANGRTCAMIDNPLNTDLEISKLRRSHPIRFAADHYNSTQHYDIDKMSELNKSFDTFVIGSDQMWNPDLSRPYKQTYFLDFADNNKRKFSFAVSFGKETYSGSEEEIEKTRHDLSRFTAVSVRDDFSHSILDSTFKVHSDIVLDPVFLCDKKHYDDLIGEGEELKISSKFAFAYILDPNLVLGDNISRIADELGIPIYICFNEGGDKLKYRQDINIHSDKVKCFDDPTIQEWLYLFKNAEFILTDSYHGVCFSIIYNKPFVVKKNTRRGGQRFEHLLDVFGLKNNMITDPSSLYAKALALDKKAEYNLDIDLLHFSKQWIEKI